MAMLKDVNDKVYKIIGSCMEVHKALGPGYPESFYKKALEIELKNKSLSFQPDHSVQVMYKELLVGTTTVDFIVEEKVALMVRSQDGLKDVEVQQLLRIMALAGCQIGVLVNFGQAKIQYKRVLPGYQQRETRKEPYRALGYREMGRTREGNPAI